MKPLNEDNLKELINQRLTDTGYALVCEYKLFRIRKDLSLQLTGNLQADTDGIEAILSAIDCERAALDAFEKGETEPAPPPANNAVLEVALSVVRRLAKETADLRGVGICALGPMVIVVRDGKEHSINLTHVTPKVAAQLVAQVVGALRAEEQPTAPPGTPSQGAQGARP